MGLVREILPVFMHDGYMSHFAAGFCVQFTVKVNENIIHLQNFCQSFVAGFTGKTFSPHDIYDS